MIDKTRKALSESESALLAKYVHTYKEFSFGRWCHSQGSNIQKIDINIKNRIYTLCRIFIYFFFLFSRINIYTIGAKYTV